MLIPTYFCDCCGHAFSHPVTTNMRGKCPKCGDLNFEVLIAEKGTTVGHQSSPVSLRDRAHKTKRAMHRLKARSHRPSALLCGEGGGVGKHINISSARCRLDLTINGKY